MYGLLSVTDLDRWTERRSGYCPPVTDPTKASRNMTNTLTWRSDFAKHGFIHHHSQEDRSEILVSIPDDEGTDQLPGHLDICF